MLCPPWGNFGLTPTHPNVHKGLSQFFNASVGFAVTR
jgi:hypothetical protein